MMLCFLFIVVKLSQQGFKALTFSQALFRSVYIASVGHKF